MRTVRGRRGRGRPDEADLVVAGLLALFVLAAGALLGQLLAESVVDGRTAGAWCRWGLTACGAAGAGYLVVRRLG